MKTISIRLPKQLLKKTDELVRELKIPRTEYVRMAIEHVNKEVEVELRRSHLMNVSQRVREESMKINAEFNEVENDPQS